MHFCSGQDLSARGSTYLTVDILATGRTVGLHHTITRTLQGHTTKTACTEMQAVPQSLRFYSSSADSITFGQSSD